MHSYTLSLAAIFLIALANLDVSDAGNPKRCACSGLGDPCRTSWYGRRYCYVVDPSACTSAQQSTRIKGIYFAYDPCKAEVNWHPYNG